MHVCMCLKGGYIHGCVLERMQSVAIEKAPVWTYDSVNITRFELSCLASVRFADITRKIKGFVMCRHYTVFYPFKAS